MTLDAAQLARQTFAMILAGGRGSRLMQLTDWRSKPAVPFGGKFRLIDFTLSNCVNSGVRRVGVATQYKAQSLIRHVQRGWSFLDGRFDEYVQLLPAQQQVDETKWYAGTADAVYQNLALIRQVDPRLVLILSGDHIYKMDYRSLIATHLERGADLTIAAVHVPRSESSGFGVIDVDADDRIARFLEKPRDPPPAPGRPDESLASMGVYLFDSRLLLEELTRDARDETSSHDFGKDLIPRLIRTHRVCVHRFDETPPPGSDDRPYWRDVGTIDSYWAANMDLTSVTPALNLYDRAWPIWTYQEQLPPAKFVFDDDDRRGMAIDSLVSGGCIVSGSAVRRSMLFSSVRVNSWATVEDSVLLTGVNVGRHAVVKRAVIDKHCRIPEGMTIGVDVDEDRKRFHVSESGITLVTMEMLGQDPLRMPF